MTDEYDPKDSEDPWHIAGTKVVTIEEKKYDLTVEFFVASDKQNNYYFIISPTIAEHVDPIPFVGEWMGNIPVNDPETGKTIEYKNIRLTINNDLTGTFGEDAVTFTQKGGSYEYIGETYELSFTYDSEIDEIYLRYETENHNLCYSAYFNRA
jgi:hypothetical protein